MTWTSMLMIFKKNALFLLVVFHLSLFMIDSSDVIEARWMLFTHSEHHDFELWDRWRLTDILITLMSEFFYILLRFIDAEWS